ncbi:OLC1v1001838C3 [Oldenlandia corymbosa var. corymbosa]|uniref:3-hydroxyisobutyryl-CoA hydrolase n=1 Tax=Oldenlandia corymbosa var. corymbosa TaxID=529605 RepID=A0AAV1D6D3_OLDCO|nr:OLC1v1001838C3 [Oldenlandia corymbosa var. corymbosa]
MSTRITMAGTALSKADMDLVLVEEKSSARTLILNRPKQLNALNYPMISRLLDLYLEFEQDPNVKLIVMKGTGRAFCAGGDVATVVRDISQGNWRLGAHFFRKEFTLNFLIATYSKPQVLIYDCNGIFSLSPFLFLKDDMEVSSLPNSHIELIYLSKVSTLNGIVMGGGAGVSVHGRFRVATENTVFAMPETALGLFPDIGASYFLSKLPGFFGEYVGLTGYRLDGAEMLVCGLATHYVPAERLSSLEDALYGANSSDLATISSIIDKFSQVPILKGTSAYHRLKIINKCFARRTVEEILSALEGEAASNKDDWILSAIDSLKKASPTSLKISLRSIREGRLQGIGKCLAREYRMVCHVMRGEMSKDFFEGCRAILIDKDKNPKWQPSKLELVDEAMVDKYFSRVQDEDWEELEFPPRSNLPAHAIAKL